MEVILRKQPKKYLASVDARTRAKLYKGIDEVSRLEGDIKPLKGEHNEYRYKIEHYRILFTYDKQGALVIITTINTRTNIKY